MKIQQYLKIFAASLLVWLLFAFTRSQFANNAIGNVLQLSSFVYLIAYFILSFLCLKKYDGVLSTWGIVIALILGTSFIDVLLRLSVDEFVLRLGIFPEYIMRVIAILLGLLCYKMANMKWKVVVVSGTLLLGLWASTFGFNLWSDMIDSIVSKRSDESAQIKPIALVSSSGEGMNITDFKGKLLILPIWELDNEECIASLPAMQKVWECYKDNAKVEFLSLYCSGRNESISTVKDFLHAQGYSFPFVLADGKDIEKQMYNSWRFSLPKFMLINKEGEKVIVSDNVISERDLAVIDHFLAE